MQQPPPAFLDKSRRDRYIVHSTTIRRISKVNCKADDRQAKESEDWHVVPNPKAKIMTKIQGSLLDR